MTKIPVTYISSIANLTPKIVLIEPVEVTEHPQARSR